jgi:hypothetical protein
MNNLEKLLFLEITNKQFTKMQTSDYYATLKLLSDSEKDEFYDLANEIHTIWNYLNIPPNITLSKNYNSFDEYKNEINVSSKIIKIINDFNLNLKDNISDELKKSIISSFGRDFYDQNFGD